MVPSGWGGRARRAPGGRGGAELFEETGLELAEELELVGAYPIWVYGHDVLQLSYRARVRDGDVAISHEHSGAHWIDPSQMRQNMNDAVLEHLAAGDERRRDGGSHRDDLDRYLRRVGRT